MPGRRSYDDGCGTAYALDIVGERWSLLVVRELLLGPKRFTDLKAGLAGASANVLSQRLRELEEADVLRRRRLPPPAASQVYELTEWGRDLEPAIIHLGLWALRSPTMPTDAHIGPDSLMLSLRARFDPERADGLTATYELWLDDLPFRAVVDDGRVEIARGEADRPDVIVHAGATVLDKVIDGLRGLDDALRADEISVKGDRDALTAFLGLFPTPQPAADARKSAAAVRA